MKKIVLFVMTQKGFAVFNRMLELNSELIDYVVVDNDNSVENDFSNEIIELAKTSNINYFIRGDEPSVDINNYIFAISWRWMISHPTNRLIVFHDSLLPKYRGFAPLVNMLINRESIIGVSAIFGASEYDKGDLISQQYSEISYPITISEAINLNNKNYIGLIDEIIAKISVGEKLVGVPQNELDATYSIWRDNDDYFINWNETAEEIKRLIDAVGSPYRGARARTSNGHIVKFLKAEVVNDVYCELRHIGKVIFINDGMPTVVCGKGLLRIIEAYQLVSKEESPYLPMKTFRVKFV